MNTTKSDAVPCKKCGSKIDPLAVFPGGICLDCHTKKFDAEVAKNRGMLPRPDFSRVFSKRHLKRYNITYTDAGDAQQVVNWRGHDAQDAEERFLDSLEEEGGSEGVRVLSVTPARPYGTRVAK